MATPRAPGRRGQTTTTTTTTETVIKAPARAQKKRRPTADALPLFAQAMRREDAARVAEPAAGYLPSIISTGLASLDRVLRGGFASPGAHLVAARPHVGATGLLLGAALSAIKHGERVAVLTERLRPSQVRGRIVVLEAKINAFRFRAGIVTDEDQKSLAETRAILPWTNLSIVAEPRISPRRLEEHVYSYRPALVLVDPANAEGVVELAEAARHRGIALVVRITLDKAEYAPTRLDLPRVGELANVFDSVILLHRDDVETPAQGDAHVGDAMASVIRVAGHDVEPREVRLRFDQRYAGLFDA
jgi:predicted ATP-dependent serine protease